MEEYKSNSYKSKERATEPIAEKRVEKVVTGEVKTRKKSGLMKLINIFGPDDINATMNNICDEIVVPAIKNVVLDAFQTFLGVNGKSRDGRSAASRVSYRKYYEEAPRRDYSAPRTRNGYDYEDVIFKNRGEAEAVLSRMDEIVATYGVVSVLDFYDLSGIDDEGIVKYTDNKYGWTDIRNATIVRIRDGGYIIKLPRALPIN